MLQRSPLSANIQNVLHWPQAAFFTELFNTEVWYSAAFLGYQVGADALGDKIEIILDAGVRRGTQVLKALAIGAKACMIGRGSLWRWLLLDSQQSNQPWSAFAVKLNEA